MNVNTANQGGANIEPDPTMEPLLRRGFEMVAAGSKQVEVLKVLTQEGLRNRRGRPFIRQEFHRVLRSPVYAGWICPKSTPDLRAKERSAAVILREHGVEVDVVSGVTDGYFPTWRNFDGEVPNQRRNVRPKLEVSM